MGIFSQKPRIEFETALKIVGVPDFLDLEWVNERAFIVQNDTRFAVLDETGDQCAAEVAGQKAFEDELNRLYMHWRDAIEFAMSAHLEKLELDSTWRVVRGTGRVCEISPTQSWKRTAEKIAQVIEGYGFPVGEIDAPKQWTVDHVLTGVKHYAEVFGGRSLTSLFERNLVHV